jgi:hypothetical protein
MREANHSARFGFFARSAALVCLTLMPVMATDGGSANGADAVIDLPRTVPKVWYRAGKGALVGGSKSGDLTISDTGLTFTTRKREVKIPLEAIHTVSFGKMRGDVNTDWVVIALVDEQGRRVIGLKDGRKLGYGQKTGELFETILAAMKKLGAAQYHVPVGFETFDGMDDQFTIALPAGWSAHPRTQVHVSGQAIWGTILFSPSPLVPDSSLPATQQDEARSSALREAESGRTGAVFVQLREALRGMRCEGFSEKARATLREWSETDPLFSAGQGTEQSTRIEPIEVDGCNGLRVVRRSLQAGGEERILDLRAASDGETVFLVGLRSRRDRYESHLETFDTVAGSFRFSVARRAPQ